MGTVRHEIDDKTQTNGPGVSVAGVVGTLVLVLVAAFGLYLTSAVIVSAAETSATPTRTPFVWLGIYLLAAIGLPMLVALRRRSRRQLSVTRTIALAAAIRIGVTPPALPGDGRTPRHVGRVLRRPRCAGALGRRHYRVVGCQTLRVRAYNQRKIDIVESQLRHGEDVLARGRAFEPTWWDGLDLARIVRWSGVRCRRDRGSALVARSP